MHALVMGAGVFSGAEVVLALLARDHRVCGLPPFQWTNVIYSRIINGYPLWNLLSCGE